MKKVLFTALSLAAAISLNATVYATVNGKDVTEKELATSRHRQRRYRCS